MASTAAFMVSARHIEAFRPQPRVTSLEESRHGRRLRTKLKAFLKFFALPIREYYAVPPRPAYLQRQNRQHNQGNHGDAAALACPVYHIQVSDDEMVLCKATEEQPHYFSPLLSTDIVPIASYHSDQSYPASFVRQVDSVVPLIQPLNETNHELNQNIAHVTDIPSEPAPDYFRLFPSIATNGEPFSSSAVQTHHDVGSLYHFDRNDPLSMQLQPSNTLTATTSSSNEGDPPRPTILSRPHRSDSSATISTLSTPATTVRGQPISSPLSWTLIRGQYSFPKNGPTPRQLSFLSSVESLGRFGVPCSSLSTTTVAVMPTPDGDTPAYTESYPLQDYGFPIVSSGSRIG